MENKLFYSFDDEPVSKFCYDISNQRIEVHFTGHYDLQKENNNFITGPCIFIIENWKEAKSKIGDDNKLYPLNNHIGVFSMILFMNFSNNSLEMLVRTIDNRYVTFIFLEPNLSLW